MTTSQYLAALRKLGLTPASKATAEALGLSTRHCRRLAAGAAIPPIVAILLRVLTGETVRVPLARTSSESR